MVEQILKQINDLYSDTSVPIETILEKLEEIQEAVENKIITLREEIG